MRDRVPKNRGRVRLTPVPGQDNLYDLVRADDPITEGTPLCKATLLPDSVCDVLGIDRETSTPADALLAIPAVLGKALLRITAKHADGSAYTGLKINGITGVDAARCVTDDAGKLMVYVSEGSYTLSSAEAGTVIDATMANQTVAVKAGDIKDVVMAEVAKTTKEARITSTRTLRFSPNVTSVDVFCVGGGGGGCGTAVDDDWGYGCGGGGGRTKTQLNVSFTPGVSYQAIVGAGGGGGSNLDSPATSRSGSVGGGTSLLGVSAMGGNGARANPSSYPYSSGGNGGSGGGSWLGYGGTDGGDGTSSNGHGSAAGTGQGTTTRAFGEASGALYASGGRGGYANMGQASNGAANTGNGGDGGAGTSIVIGGKYVWPGGGNGGSGIIIIRWRTKT